MDGLALQGETLHTWVAPASPWKASSLEGFCPNLTMIWVTVLFPSSSRGGRREVPEQGQHGSICLEIKGFKRWGAVCQGGLG